MARLRYFLFAIGLTMALFSNAADLYSLFWGLLLFILGYAFAGAAFLAILYHGPKRNRIVFTSVVIAFCFLKYPLSKFVTTQAYSYKIYRSEPSFAEANRILMSKSNQGEISFPITKKKDESLFTATERDFLNKFLKTSHLSFIRKNDVHIYYCVYGLMDNDYGLFYFYSTEKPTDHFIHIKGQWYYD